MDITLGQKFKNLCFIGLDRVEYHAEGSDQPMFADSWQDVTDEQSRRNLGLVFFAPRELDGEPVNPYAYLTIEDGMDEVDDESLMVAQHTLGGVPLLDFCRMTPAQPNTVNILVVADIIYHWDMQDNYIQPTTALEWIRDIKQIVKGYPRSTEFNLYTDWEAERLSEFRIKVYNVSEVPFDTHTWLNMPTFQEKFGLHTLAASILIALAAFGLTNQQESTLDDLSTQIRQVEAATPRGGNSRILAELIGSQEEQMYYRYLMPLLVKDAAVAIQASEMKAESFEVKNVNPKEPPLIMLASVKAQKGAYKGWLQEEPVAKKLLANSTTWTEIRKPPSPNQFKLEGLIDLESVAVKVEEYQDRQEQLSEEMKALNASLNETEEASGETEINDNEEGTEQ